MLPAPLLQDGGFRVLCALRAGLTAALLHLCPGAKLLLELEMSRRGSRASRGAGRATSLRVSPFGFGEPQENPIPSDTFCPIVKN